MIPIFVTSWHRPAMTERALCEIEERTRFAHEVHLWDNGSTPEEQQALIGMYQVGLCDHLHLLSHNAGCVFPNGIFRALAGDAEYFVMTDNDAYPPKLDPCWLTEMVCIMREHEELGCLGLRAPPEFLQSPLPGEMEGRDKIIRCKAIGNQFKMIRAEAWPDDWNTVKGQFGDDFYLCDMMAKDGWYTAFCRDLYCLHAGQTQNWGYSPEQIAEDPRKAGYGPPFIYDYDPITYTPKGA